jgi:hypothetical protein
VSKGDKANNNPNRYNLRSKNKGGNPHVPEQPTREENPAKDVASSNQEKKTQNPSPIAKGPIPEVRKILNPPSSFSFEHEIQKIIILVPLSELVKHEDFKKSLSKMLQSEPSFHSTDSVNLQDEKPIVILGPMVEDRDDSSPPLYTSLNIHDKVLHNCLIDSGASHNLMPKTVMEELGLEITKSYHDLYSFDSRKVQCLGVIKDLVVTLFQLPMKSMVMDIVVADVPPKFGMLLSRSWIKRLGGTLQMDLTYDTIHVFGGSIEDCIEKLSWPTLLVMNLTPPIILYFHLILIWDLAYCCSLMPLNLLLRSKNSPLLSVKILLPLPLFGKCSLMEHLLGKVLVPG